MKHLLILLVVLSFSLKAQTRDELYMIKCVNQLRANPKSFIPYVESYIEKQEVLKLNGGIDTSKLKVSGLRISSKNIKLRDELIAEANNLIKFLETQAPVSVLSQNTQFYTIAKTHARYLDSANLVSHNGTTGMRFGARTKGFNVLENICKVNEHDIIDCIVQLLLDYGMNVKPHRNNLFNVNAKEITVANSGKVWVQEFVYVLK